LATAGAQKPEVPFGTARGGLRKLDDTWDQESGELMRVKARGSIRRSGALSNERPGMLTDKRRHLEGCSLSGELPRLILSGHFDTGTHSNVFRT
jgi:hypothetical protein